MPVTPELLEKIKMIVGPKGALTDPADVAPHVEEERGLFHGATPMVVKPASTDELAQVVKLCAEAGVPLVPQGGNTGLVGGAVPHESGGQIVICTSRLNRVRAVDPLDYTMTVEAGVILADVQKAAEAADRYFPLSLGAEGSCQIGGNIAANAGGINVLRYGNTRALVLGVEAVLPDGRVWNGLKALGKDNTGYDLTSLFVGSEGTLGIITAAVLKLFPRPRDIQTALCGIDHLDKVVELLSRARQASGDAVNAFELISRFAYDITITHAEGLSELFEQPHDWYVLIEMSSSSEGGALRESFEKLLEGAFEDDIIQDAVIAESLDRRSTLWRLRESVPEAQKHEGGSIKHDIAVPVSKVPEFLERALNAVTTAMPGIRPCPFGHVGDGNIHFNLSQPVDMDKAEFLGRWQEMNDLVHAVVADLNGSISAEHGIGRLKVEEITHYKDPAALDMQRAIKRALDPKGLMNPGKVVL